VHHVIIWPLLWEALAGIVNALYTHAPLVNNSIALTLSASACQTWLLCSHSGRCDVDYLLLSDQDLLGKAEFELAHVALPVCREVPVSQHKRNSKKTERGSLRQRSLTCTIETDQ
jgi:hypothetical protein